MGFVFGSCGSESSNTLIRLSSERGRVGEADLWSR